MNHHLAIQRRMQRKPVSIDLFAGCGGMSLGLVNAGFRVILANDINADALSTYGQNFPEVKVLLDDIQKIDPRKIRNELDQKKIDIIVAGPPCQGFSLAGRRNINDPRNKLFRNLIQFVNTIRPKIFVMENVRGILSIDKGRAIKGILSEFSKLGYHVHLKTLIASNYGVPQSRERVFIIGTTKNIPEKELFPKRKTREKISSGKAISDLAFLAVSEKSNKYKLPARTKYQQMMRKRSTILYNHESPRHSKKIQRRFALIPMGMNGHDALKRVKTCKHTYYKLNPKNVSRTITTLPEDFVHYEKNRIPTVREMARLQSFPDDFVFLGPRTTGGQQRRDSCPQYTQVGNAVPPLLSEAVFKNLRKILVKYY